MNAGLRNDGGSLRGGIRRRWSALGKSTGCRDGRARACGQGGEAGWHVAHLGQDGTRSRGAGHPRRARGDWPDRDGGRVDHRRHHGPETEMGSRTEGSGAQLTADQRDLQQDKASRGSRLCKYCENHPVKAHTHFPWPPRRAQGRTGCKRSADETRCRYCCLCAPCAPESRVSPGPSCRARQVPSADAAHPAGARAPRSGGCHEGNAQILRRNHRERCLSALGKVLNTSEKEEFPCPSCDGTPCDVRLLWLGTASGVRCARFCGFSPGTLGKTSRARSAKEVAHKVRGISGAISRSGSAGRSFRAGARRHEQRRRGIIRDESQSTR